MAFYYFASQPTAGASTDQKTYRARPVGRDACSVLKIEFEEENLAQAIRRLIGIKNQGNFVIEIGNERLGIVHIVGRGEWWFSSF